MIKLFVQWGWIILVVLFVYDIVFYTGDMYYTNIGAGFFGLICAGWCAKWAIKINKNVNFAILLGGMLNLIGVAIYYFYYRKGLKNETK